MLRALTRELLKLVAEGKPHKYIANVLDRSVKYDRETPLQSAGIPLLAASIRAAIFGRHRMQGIKTIKINQIMPWLSTIGWE